MKKEEAYYLGKIVKKYGLKGELLAKIDTDEPETYENLESVFLDIKGKLIPFFMTSCSLHKSNLLRIKFEDFDTVEDAESLQGKEMYLPLSTLPELTGNQFYFHEVVGFQAVDHELGTFGVIKAINDNSPQAFFIIVDQEHEILIPVSDYFISKIDRNSKTVFFNTPEGLIDIYRK